MSASTLDPMSQVAFELGRSVGTSMVQIRDEVSNHAYVLATMQEFFRRCALDDQRDGRARTSREKIAEQVKQDAEAYSAVFYEKESP